MGKYWLICLVIAVVVFAGTFGFFTIANSVAIKNMEKEREEIKDSTVAIRYYLDDSQGKMVFERIEKGTTEFEISYIPEVSGRTFLGLYDGVDEGMIYVDSLGQGLLPITEDMMLYPLFE